MKAALTRSVGKYDVTVSYFRGYRKLFSQDFIAVQNLLLDDKNFQATLTGVLFTTPRPNLRVKAPGIEITNEFYRDVDMNVLIPLWYRYKLKRPVQATATIDKSLSFQTIPGETLVTISNLLEKKGQLIVIDRFRFYIDGQLQTVSAYNINHADGSVSVDLSAFPPNVYNIEILYTLVQLSIDVKPLEGVWSLRVQSHYKDEFIVDILTSTPSAVYVKYQYRGQSFEETVVPNILFTEVEKELVANETYTFSYTESIKFPTRKTYVLYAIRKKRPYLETMFGCRAPRGLDYNRPWFLKLEGIVPAGYRVAEMEGVYEKPEGRRQRGVVIGKNQIMIGASKLFITGGEGKYIKGIDVYFRDNPDVLVPVESYDPITGVITLGIEIPATSEVFAEFREIVDWAEYEDLQLNPVLEADPEYVIKHKFLLYIDLNSADPKRSVYHVALPKIVNGEFYNYTINELRAVVASKTSRGIPLALAEIVETTDEDYYSDYDMRTRGGYSGRTRKITDRIFWDGEDVDITGQLFTYVPKRLVEAETQRELFWNVGITTTEAELIAKRRIESVIIDATRVGMQNEIIFEEQ